MQARHNGGVRLDTEFVIDFVRTHVPGHDDANPAVVWKTAQEPSESGSWVLVMDYADASLQQVENVTIRVQGLGTSWHVVITTAL